MLKKRLTNIAKLTGLIGVRQGFFLTRNWYLLLTEPFITIKNIRETKDKSQIFLIGLTALSPVGIYIILRILWDLWKYGEILWMTGRVFLVMGIVQAIILGYLGYWVLKVFKEN